MRFKSILAKKNFKQNILPDTFEANILNGSPFHLHVADKTFYLDANKLFNKFQNTGFYVIDNPINIKFLNNVFFRFLRNKFVSIEFLAIKK